MQSGVSAVSVLGTVLDDVPSSSGGWALELLSLGVLVALQTPGGVDLSKVFWRLVSDKVIVSFCLGGLASKVLFWRRRVPEPAFPIKVLPQDIRRQFPSEMLFCTSDEPVAFTAGKVRLIQREVSVASLETEVAGSVGSLSPLGLFALDGVRSTVIFLGSGI